MRLSENAIPGGESLQDRWRGASASARKSEHHWPADCLAEAADVLDHMEGWRPPPRRIETIAELESLPEYTVVRWEAPDGLSRGVIERFDGAWWSPGHHAQLLPERISLPATVLWEPEEIPR
jgi:hypothetical protein